MTSNKTNEEVKRILDKYISKEDQVKLFKELTGVKGNKSFTDTIKNLLILITTK